MISVPMDLYDVVKVIHILLVAIAVGFNASYAIWIARASRTPDGQDHLGHVLRGIKFLDDRFANPAYALLLVTGVAMVLIGGIPFTTFWIAASLVLYVVAVGLGFGLYSPVLRRQIAVLETDGAGSARFRDVSSRASIYGILTMLPFLAIIVLRVTKPTL